MNINLNVKTTINNATKFLSLTLADSITFSLNLAISLGLAYKTPSFLCHLSDMITIDL